MKFYYLIVSGLNTNNEKDTLLRQFQNHGWEHWDTIYENKVILKKLLVINRYMVSWNYESKMIIPDLPNGCTIEECPPV